MSILYFQARHSAERFFKGEPQFIDIKHLVDLENRFRVQCRETICRYRQCKRELTVIEDLTERHYRFLEGTLLRQQAEDAARLYGLIRRDIRRSFDKYIAAAARPRF